MKPAVDLYRLPFYRKEFFLIALSTLFLVGVYPVFAQSPAVKSDSPATNNAVSSVKQKTVTKLVNGTLTSASPQISIDLGLHAFSDVLPFDAPFLMVGTQGSNSTLAIQDINLVDCWYIPEKVKKKPVIGTNNLDGDQRKWEHTSWQSDGIDKQFVLHIDALKPNKDYTFFIKFRVKLGNDVQKQLKLITNAAVKAAIYKKAQGANFIFTRPEIGNILDDIAVQTDKSLTTQGLSVDFSNVDPAYTDSLLQSIETIGNSFNDVREAKKLLIDNVNIYKSKKAVFQAFSVSGLAASDQKYLDTVLAQWAKLIAYPQDMDAQNTAKSQKYLADCDAFVKLVNRGRLTDAGFAPAQTQLVSLVNTKIKTTFNDYAAALKTVETTTSAQQNVVIDAMAANLYVNTLVDGSSLSGDFVTRANTYVSLDLGVAVIPNIVKLAPYVGTNIYFRPVNKNVPLIWGRDPDWFGERFSLLVGLTVGSLAKDHYRADLLGANINPLTGVGFRVFDFVRLNGGFVWFSQLNNDPLNSNNSVAAKYFVSLSFDIDVKTVFNSLFSSSTLTSFQ